jgi:5'-3' exoribonuclease 2
VAASTTNDIANKMLFIDMNVLSDAILQEMGVQESHRIYDYLFLCFFLGNDFLPHFPSLNIRTNGIHLLLDLYKNVIGKYPERGFIVEGKIQWKWFKLFVEKLSQNEKQMIMNEYSVRDKMDYYKWAQTTQEEKEYVLHNTPVIYRAEEKYICPQENMWEERYYKMLFHRERTRDSTREITTNLLEGFEWVFKYYTTDCPDWKWKYRFHYPPLLKDMVRFIPDSSKDFICPGQNGLKPFTQQLQLAYVLPPANHFLLGEKNAAYLKTFCESWFPGEMKYRWAFCRYFFESHLELPDIKTADLERVEKVFVE